MISFYTLKGNTEALFRQQVSGNGGAKCQVMKVPHLLARLFKCLIVQLPFVMHCYGSYQPVCGMVAAIAACMACDVMWVAVVWGLTWHRCCCGSAVGC